MEANQSQLKGNLQLLLLKLLESGDMYGYQMIDQLEKKSDHTFSLKAGTLYPILHAMERDELVSVYDQNAGGGRIRKYYHITSKGRTVLRQKEADWRFYSKSVNQVLDGGCI